MPILQPTRFCDYINDHTIFRDGAGSWRLLGTCATGDYAFYKERYLVEGVGDDLFGNLVESRTLLNRQGWPPVRISPMVFWDAKTGWYHLFIGPMTIRHFTSSDGREWRQAPDAIHSLWPPLRDPHVIEAEGKYLMYLTDRDNKISVFQSADLYDWKWQATALRLGEGIPRSLNSACESPVVFSWRKYFVLLTTITPMTSSLITRRENYNHTVAFVSLDPTHFGVHALNSDNSASLVAHLETHAPELVVYHRDHYLTTCGWRGFPKPPGVAGEGVYARRLVLYEDGY